MVKITHYEVYTDQGDGWKLDGRFSRDQRYEAVNLSKEKEQKKLKVKIIKEVFDVQDNTYSESVEYISGLSSPRKNSDPLSPQNIGSRNGGSSSGSGENASGAESRASGIVNAIVRLISIITICLVLSNVLVTLVQPLVDDYVAEDKINITLFFIFIISFLVMVIPLVLQKVPWHVFDFSGGKRKKIKERKFFNKAENIIKLYQLNDNFDPSIAPAYPEAPLEHKKYIVAFLHEILSKLDFQSIYTESFSKLGVKLIVYGGCMELSKYSGLKITEANSLLYEAFKIIDGDKPDLEDFYDAKRTFNDNKVAIFLTGVGAYLMAQVIDEKPMDSYVLEETFAKWEGLINNYQEIYAKEDVVEIVDPAPVQTVSSCLVVIQTLFKFFDEAIPDLEEQKERYKADIRNIINNIFGKYKDGSVVENNAVTTVEYGKIQDAVKFATEFVKNISEYREDIDNENLIFLSKCSIIDKPEGDETNLEDYIDDILEHTYNNEILVTEKVKNSITDTEYHFEYLGEKKLNKLNKPAALYKLAY